MIVCCERCDTRFKLDESRIPARGARVRCSRCKHAFFVTPPGASPEQQVHAVAAEAARAPEAKPRPPEPSWDLEEGPAATVVSLRTRKASTGAASAGSEEDSDWRFEDDVPGLDPGATRVSIGSPSLDLSGSQTSPSLVVPPDPNEDSFAELGDPETWDLLAGDAPPVAAPAAPKPARAAAPAAAAPTPVPAPVAARVVAPTPAPPAPVAAPAPRVAVAPAPPIVVAAPPPSFSEPLSARSRPALPSRGAWAGWAGLAALVAATLFGVVRAPAPATVAVAPVAGFEVTRARVRTVENAAAGPILVVSGELRNAGSGPRALGAPLVVQLLDADGAPLAGATASVGPALSEARVREESPEALRAAQDVAAPTLAQAQVAGGAVLAFDAVFAEAPRAAARFAVTAQGGGAGR